MTSEKLVIGVAGMAGSGKSLIINVAKQTGYDIVVMGDEVREEAKKRNIAPTPENLGKTMLELRKTEGEAAIAKRCVSKNRKRPQAKSGRRRHKKPRRNRGIQETLPKFHTNRRPLITRNKIQKNH